MKAEPAWLVAGAALLLCACTATGPRGGRGVREGQTPANPMEQILASHPGLRPVVEEAAGFRLQAVLGLIEPGSDGEPVLIQHGFRLGVEYFYPASTVKLFAAAAALERLAALRDETGQAITPDTALTYHPLFADERLQDSDPTNVDGERITVRQEIRKIFLVSDNEAFNRLYELVGQDRLAASLARAGFPEARIVHRLSEPHTPEEDRRTPQIELVGEDFRHTLPERASEPLPPAPPMPGLQVGTAHVAGGERVEEPFDMQPKNRVALVDLQRALCTIVRPDVACGVPGFRLGDPDRALLLEAMRQLPRESENPLYDAAEYPDAYVKFILPGVRRVIPGDPVRILDKTGQAYGFTIENAYVVDEETGRGFFLAATLYTNSNETLNDDDYDYDTVALPFLADLGEAATRYVFNPSR